jgi:phenylacetate-CoA ligase
MQGAIYIGNPTDLIMYPTLVRNAFFPLHEKLLRRPTFDYLAELEKTQWLSRSAIEGLQLRRLKDLLETAIDHSPWHAERIRAVGIVLSEGRDLAFSDLRRLPTMTRADAKTNHDRLVWRGVPGGVFQYNTGGSSGEPLIFHYGRARQAADLACRMRARRWWRVEVGDPEVFLWGAPVELDKTDRIKTLRDRLFNQCLLNAFEMSERQMSDYLKTIRSFDPVCLYGYASSLSLLASYAKNRGRIPKLPRLKLVCTTGEPLLPEQRTLLLEVFGAPVSNEYGARDSGLIALESPDGQMLVNSESIIVEILDREGNPVPPGETGEVVVTHLCSAAQPFIRYRTGDVARLSDDPCKAGRGLHCLKEIMGRTTDFVVRPDGAVMHALALIYIPRTIEGVEEFKIIQWSTTRIEVLIRPNSAWKAGTEREVVSRMGKRMGRGVKIDVAMVDKIPPEASGKHRYVVSHVPVTSGW